MTTTELLKPADISAMLGLTTGRVYQLIGEGAIPSICMGRSIRIPRRAWEDWLETQNQNARAAVKTSSKAEDVCS